MTTQTPESEWKWFGDAGHFICGRWCRFHLCTQIGRFLVSTVGAYVHPRHSMGSELREREWLEANFPGEDIGWGRKYETMVFLAGEPCSEPTCGCGLPVNSGNELAFDGYNDAGAATNGHYKMCCRVAAGEIVVEDVEVTR